MTAQDKIRWKDWADSLRQEMMTGLDVEVTKSVETIISETGTSKAKSTVCSTRFWQACQNGRPPNEFLLKAGFEIDLVVALEVTCY